MLMLITALLLSLAQFILVRRASSSLCLIVPDLEIECGKELDLRFETRSFPVLPGCIVRIAIDFSWHHRAIQGRSVYRSNSRHGLISIYVERRGRFFSPGGYFEISDAAGFFRFRTRSRHEELLAVKPGIIDDFRIPRIRTRGGEDKSRATRKRRSDVLIETRQYAPGDDVRRINWKTFAHLGELFIRQGEELPDPDSRLTVITDLSGSSGSGLKPNELDYYLDYLVSVFAGVIDHFRAQGVSLEILLPDGSRAASGGFLPGLWWTDTSSAIEPDGRSSYLLLCPPFSARAEKIRHSLLFSGRPVSIAVPVPPQKQPRYKPGRLSRLFFTGSEADKEGFRGDLLAEAEEFVSEFNSGGGNAVVI